MVEERRQAERHRVAFRVCFAAGESFTVGMVVDLSMSGAFMHTEQLLPVGTNVQLEPVGPAAAYLHRLDGRVARLVEPSANDANQPSGMGLEFLGVEGAVREALARLIHEIPTASGGMMAPIAEEPGGPNVGATYRTGQKIYADTGSE